VPVLGRVSRLLVATLAHAGAAEPWPERWMAIAPAPRWGCGSDEIAAADEVGADRDGGPA